jgi:predicted nucleic acid-binding protein
MRLVVDTNVFVSAALKENSLPFLVVRWIDRHEQQQPRRLPSLPPCRR